MVAYRFLFELDLLLEDSVGGLDSEEADEALFALLFDFLRTFLLAFSLESIPVQRSNANLKILT